MLALAEGAVGDGEAGAHVYAAATTRDQARIVFGEAERMVAASPALSARVTRTVNNLAVLPTASWFRPLSADASKMDGLNVHFAAVDEVHEHSGPEIIQKLNTAIPRCCVSSVWPQPESSARRRTPGAHPRLNGGHHGCEED